MPMGWAAWFSSRATKIQRSDPNSDMSSDMIREPTHELTIRTRGHDGESPMEHQDRRRLEGHMQSRDSHATCIEQEGVHYNTRKNMVEAFGNFEHEKQKLSRLELENRRLREKCNAARAQALSEYQELTNRVSNLEQDNHKLSSQLETSKNHTLVLQGARRASLVSDTVKDVSC